MSPLAHCSRGRSLSDITELTEPEDVDGDDCVRRSFDSSSDADSDVSFSSAATSFVPFSSSATTVVSASSSAATLASSTSSTASAKAVDVTVKSALASTRKSFRRPNKRDPEQVSKTEKGKEHGGLIGPAGHVAEQSPREADSTTTDLGHGSVADLVAVRR